MASAHRRCQRTIQSEGIRSADRGPTFWRAPSDRTAALDCNPSAGTEMSRSGDYTNPCWDDMADHIDRNEDRNKAPLSEGRLQTPRILCYTDLCRHGNIYIASGRMLISSSIISNSILPPEAGTVGTWEERGTDQWHRRCRVCPLDMRRTSDTRPALERVQHRPSGIEVWSQNVVFLPSHYATRCITGFQQAVNGIQISLQKPDEIALLLNEHWDHLYWMK